jgi:kynurenine formamidase
VKLIGVDACGAMGPAKHHWVDTYCAERDVFIIENLNNVRRLLEMDAPFSVYTAPLARTDLSGLPCRIVAEFAM